MGRSSCLFAVACLLGSAACAQEKLLLPETEQSAADPAAVELAADSPAEMVAEADARPGSYVIICAMGRPASDDPPLYIVDGVTVENVDGIDPAKIESIEVIKGGQAASLYGSRGATGVVIITLRKESAPRSS